MLSMAKMWTARRPRATDWCERIKARPTDTPALRDSRPPDLTNDLGDFRRAEPAGGQAAAGRLEPGLIGGARGSRTPDLLNAIQALSQLSYGP